MSMQSCPVHHARGQALRTYQRAESDAVGLEPAQQVLLDLRDARQQREVDRRLDLLRARARTAPHNRVAVVSA